MIWHLRPSGYVLFWILLLGGTVLFRLWLPEIMQQRELVSLVVVFVMAIAIGLAVHAL